MSNNPFAPPATGGSIEWPELNGALLIFEVGDEVKDVQTVHGPSDARRANVVVVDGPKAGTRYDDSLIFPKVLQGSLRGKEGQKVLGRLTQGTPTGPGKSAPWVLVATDNPAEIAAAVAALGSTIQAPAPAGATY